MCVCVYVSVCVCVMWGWEGLRQSLRRGVTGRFITRWPTSHNDAWSPAGRGAWTSEAEKHHRYSHIVHKHTHTHTDLRHNVNFIQCHNPLPSAGVNRGGKPRVEHSSKFQNDTHLFRWIWDKSVFANVAIVLLFIFLFCFCYCFSCQLLRHITASPMIFEKDYWLIY